MYYVDAEGKLRFRPHPGQLEAWDARERFVAVIAGTQSGKTTFGPFWLYREMKRRGPGDYLIAAPSYPLLSAKLVPELKRLFKTHLDLGEYREQPNPKFYVSPKGCMHLWGRVPDSVPTIHLGYAANPDSLESMTVLAAWLDEAGQRLFKAASFEAILRRLSLSQGRVLITTTPYFVASWLKRRIFDQASDPRESIRIVNFRSIDNPVFPREEYEDRRRTMPRWKFDMMYNGIFTRPAGQIYGNFDEETMCCRPFPIPERWQRYYGFDFGAVNTVCVCYAEDPATSILYLYRTYKAPGRTARQHVEAILADEPANVRIKAYGGSKSEQNWRDEFGAAGIRVEEPKVTDVELGIDRVYGAHAESQIVVFDTLEEYLEQKAEYSRDVDEEGEPLDTIADKTSFHFLDAERYVIASIRSPRQRATYVSSDPRDGEEALLPAHLQRYVYQRG